MSILCLAQSGPPITDAPSPESAYFILLMIGALLSIGLLVVIGLVVAWRHYIQRQQELEFEHEDRMADLPRADAWSTAAQRMDPPDADPDEAHIAHDIEPDDRVEDEDNFETQDDEEDDEDDFPFDRDDEDEEGPFDRA
jgi:hypothetical protein